MMINKREAQRFCIVCNKDVPIYSNNYYAIDTQGICEDCAKLIVAEFEVQNTTKIIEGLCKYSNSPERITCSHSIYFTHNSQFVTNLKIGVCQHHAQKALEYFEESRKPKVETLHARSVHDYEDYGDIKPPKPKKEKKKDESQLSLF